MKRIGNMFQVIAWKLADNVRLDICLLTFIYREILRLFYSYFEGLLETSFNIPIERIFLFWQGADLPAFTMLKC